MEAVIGVIALFAILFVIYQIKSWTNKKLNQKLFSRGTFQKQQDLTGTAFYYRTTASKEALQQAFSAYVVGPSMPFNDLYLDESNPNFTLYQYALSKQFIASFSWPVDGKAKFAFETWKTYDGVVRCLKEMERLKTRIDHAVTMADPQATQYSTPIMK